MNSLLQTILFPIYLLQLEEYNLKRFRVALQKSKGRIPDQWRAQLAWTPKMTLVFLLSFLIHAFASGTIIFVLSSIIPNLGILSALYFVLLIGLLPLFFIPLQLVVLLLNPFDSLIKSYIIRKAKNKIAQHPKLTIIAVAGSFGKTTMKELLAIVLEQKYSVLKTQKNINTPVGISRQILQELTSSHDVYIVEMGEYYRGDIAAICSITKPDIAVVTGINEAHLEKMGDLQITSATIFEVVENAKEDATIILNADSPLVVQHHSRYIGKRAKQFYSSRKNSLSRIEPKNILFKNNGEGVSFDLYENGKALGAFHTTLLGEYIIGDSIGALHIGKQRGLSVTDVQKGLERLKPIPHRLQTILNKSNNVLVIDDSYNGNPDGVGEAIKVLSRFTNRRKIYCTPGLVETGHENEKIHYTIGKQLSTVADIVILIRNSATPFIEKGLLKNSFSQQNIIWFETAQEAHNNLGTILKPNDVILFQNDWPDNYF
ncbi:UDP-N-acetylmuramoyl-tripeptide--D-alanyl-D-alanine ligase [Candidatus Roizmanbacteria bacterium]|nr:UDP-N-acetylmuramoyl-tripeptide--D-alanyl-D-alanine ligase [Candidatus Roizmanbacteria bacterium]